MVPCYILRSKLETYGFERWTIQLIRNILDSSNKRVVDNGSMFRFRLETSDVPKRSVLGLLLFNVFISDTDRGVKYTLIKSTDDTELSGTVDPTKGRDAIQRDINKLE